MKKIIFLLIFSFIDLAFIAQQNKIDSLLNILKTAKEDSNKVNILNDLSEKLRFSRNYDSSLLTAHKALQLSIKLNYLGGSANAYNNMGASNLILDNYSKAIENYFASLKIKEKLGDKIGMSNLNINIGSAYWLQSNYEDALNVYRNALKINEELGNKDRIADSYNNIGFVYSLQNKHREAIKIYLKALELYKETQNKNELGNTYDHIGVSYEKQRNFPEAEKHHLTAIKVKNEVGNKKGVSSSYLWLSNVYFNQGNHSKSLDCLLAALKINEELNDKRGLAICTHDIGKFYLQINKIPEAKLWLKKGLNISKEINKKSFIKDSYEYLAIADSSEGNFKEAYSDYKKFIVYRDILVNEENTQKTVHTQMQYKFEKKQAADSIKVEEERKLNEVKFEQEKKQRYFLYIGLLVIVVFAGFMFNRFKVSQKQSKIIVAQKHIVDEKQKEIIESITYAKRLQEAILPPQAFINKHIKENFILYKPKDLVAGDFYWAEAVNDLFFIAAADSTGHGVPGAMVSVVCSNALNRTIKEFKETETGKILDKTRELVLETFEKSASEVKDGMDISLLCIDSKNKNIFWSGAHNPLWYISPLEEPVLSLSKEGVSQLADGDVVLTEIKADKQPIGKTEYPKSFVTHQIDYKPNTTFYLFTDGFADQFGGPKGKKFMAKNFKELLSANSHLSLANQKELLENAFKNWVGDLEQVDDVCVIGIRI